MTNRMSHLGHGIGRGERRSGECFPMHDGAGPALHPHDCRPLQGLHAVGVERLLICKPFIYSWMNC